jgi:hypothetical protein
MMVYAVSSGSANHNPGPVTKGLLKDLGWVLAADTPPGAFNKSSPANAAVGQPANPTLSWGASSGATSYEYCIDDSSNNTCNTSWISTSTSTSVPLSGLALGNHSWQVRANNALGTTEANGGTWWSFTVVSASARVYLPLVIKPFPPPGAFNKSAPANGATGQPANPTLSWGASSGATSYEYCIDTSNNNACDTAWTSTAASTSAGLSGLTPATSYSWQVRANNASGTTNANGGTWWSFSIAGSPTGPTPGYWQSDNTAHELYVNTSSNAVKNFAVYVNVPGCGSYKITHLIDEPIASNQFSFGGDFYVSSGTFTSATTATVTDGLSNILIEGCGYVSGGPWTRSYSWKDGTQPSVVTASVTGPITTEFLTSTNGESVVVTPIR